jgi:hypothetical protein
MASHGVFILIHFLNFIGWVRKYVTRQGIVMLTKFFVGVLVVGMIVLLVGLYLAVGFVILLLEGKN